jgi:diadenosine tetraphosphate (Ap4A) HIT family hydrolase
VGATTIALPKASYNCPDLLAVSTGSEHDDRMTNPWGMEQTSGTVWSDPTEWERRLTPEGCVICASGGPRNVIGELSSCWVTAQPEAPLRYYTCVVARDHVVEPYEMAPDSQAAFWQEAMLVARAVASVARPTKMNYEIHGNTLPHLHLHLYPRASDDPFVGGPIDPSRSMVRRTPEDLESLKKAVEALPNDDSPVA